LFCSIVVVDGFVVLVVLVLFLRLLFLHLDVGSENVVVVIGLKRKLKWLVLGLRVGLALMSVAALLILLCVVGVSGEE
jgi:hypothetical protein